MCIAVLESVHLHVRIHVPLLVLVRGGQSAVHSHIHQLSQKVLAGACRELRRRIQRIFNVCCHASASAHNGLACCPCRMHITHMIGSTNVPFARIRCIDAPRVDIHSAGQKKAETMCVRFESADRNRVYQLIMYQPIQICDPRLWL